MKGVDIDSAVSDAQGRLGSKARAWARPDRAQAQLNHEPSPRGRLGLGPGQLGLEPRPVRDK